MNKKDKAKIIWLIILMHLTEAVFSICMIFFSMFYFIPALFSNTIFRAITTVKINNK